MRKSSDLQRRAGKVQRRGQGDSGTALVEFALVLPLLVVFLLGTITGGITLNDELQLNHATRDAARYGATIPAEETFGTGTWATNVRTVVVERFGDGLTPADVCVSLVSGSPAVPLSANHTTDGGGNACYDDSTSGISQTRVQVTAAKAAQIETGIWTADITLKANAITMHESNV